MLADERRHQPIDTASCSGALLDRDVVRVCAGYELRLMTKPPFAPWLDVPTLESCATGRAGGDPGRLAAG